MRRIWRKVDKALFAAVIPGRDGVRYHLLAERLPKSSDWDWTVWRPGDAPKFARHGDASSVEAAMRAAEAAVLEWDGRTVRRSTDDS
jgi:hypothetical protein